MIDEQKIADAKERQTILNLSDAFETLVNQPGWAYLHNLWEQWADDATKVLRQATIGNHADALIRWQAVCEVIERTDSMIDRTLKQAQTIRGSITLDDALLMEKLKNEQPESGDPGRPDPAGY